ncbi:MAG: rhomboid family intramembrane serine protease, partial [Halothece sp. Uz-M2-17]|nr:rhomboid family intramembrane serine protease [Halothece sp. Uz-M2-17]
MTCFDGYCCTRKRVIDTISENNLMDLNTILRFLVIISCISLIVRVLISRTNWGWLGVATGILGITLSCFLLIPEKSGIIGGILWLVFVLVPIIGLRQVNYFIYQEKFQHARKLASLLSWLHPADGWQKQPQFLRVLELTKTGELEAAERILTQSLQNPSYGFQDTAKAIRFRMGAQWEDCLNWFQTEISYEKLWQNSTLAIVYLRTLGEVGELNGLIWAVKSHQRQLQSLSGMTVNLARLYVFAFTGDVDAVKKLFVSTLKNYPRNKQKFWLATAEIAAGNQEVGQTILFNIENKDLTLERAIVSRLNQSVTQAESVLIPESEPIITALKKDLQEEINYGGAIRLAPTKANLTYSLMLLNSLVFLLEIYQG